MTVQRGSSPQPHWKPGDTIQGPVENMVSLNLSAMKTSDIYKLMIGVIVPRPIAFVSTINKKGIVNLAPFSYFNGVSSKPPCIVISITRKPTGEKKDTLRNIETGRQFVVNSVSEWMVEPMNYCSGDFPFGVSEMKEAGMTPLQSMIVKPPRVKESAVQMECELYDTLQIGDDSFGSSTMVVGKILIMHISEKAYENGKVLIDRLLPVARLAGTAYTKVTEVFELPRPVVGEDNRRGQNVTAQKVQVKAVE